MKKKIVSFFTRSETTSFIVGLGLALVLSLGINSVIAAGNQTEPFIGPSASLVNKIGSLTVGLDRHASWIDPYVYDSNTGAYTFSGDYGRNTCLTSYPFASEKETCLHVEGIGAFDELTVLDIPTYITDNLFLKSGTNPDISGLLTGLEAEDNFVIANDGPNSSIMATSLDYKVAGEFEPRDTTTLRGLCAEDTTGILYPCDLSAPVETYYWYTGPWGECSAGTQTRIVECRRGGDDVVVANTFCTGTQPVASQSCTVYCPAPTLTSLEHGTPGNVNYTLNGGDVTGVEFFRSADNQATWSTQGSPSLAQPGLAAILDGDFIRAQAHCSGGVVSEYSNVLQYNSSGGACVGTYTTTGTSTRVDWNGDPLNWVEDALYNDNGVAIHLCSEPIIPQNVDIWSTTNAPYTSDDNGTWGDANGTDNYYCQNIGGGSLLNTNGTYSCVQDGSGNWSISGGGPNNTSLGSQSQSIVDQLCGYGYTTAYRFWSPADSGNWAQYITAAGSGFWPGYVVTKNGYQGALTQTLGGGETRPCSDITSYGESYCNTYPGYETCSWDPNA